MQQEWSVARLAIAVEQGEVVLIDVRPPEDTADGHIPGSWLSPMPALAARLQEPEDPLAQRLRRSSGPVAVVAGGSDRWTAAAEVLGESGLSVIAVVGEVSAWSREGRPLNRGRHHEGPFDPTRGDRR